MSVLLDNQGRHRVGDEGVPVNEVLARFGMSTPVTTAATSWPVRVPSSRLVVGPQPGDPLEEPAPRKSGKRVPVTVLAAVVGLGIPGAMLASEVLSGPDSISASSLADSGSYSPPVYSGTAKPRDVAVQTSQTASGQPRLPATIAGAATGNVLDGQNPWAGRAPAPKAENVGGTALAPMVADTAGSRTTPMTGSTTPTTQSTTPTSQSPSNTTTPSPTPRSSTPAPTPSTSPETTPAPSTDSSGTKQLCLLGLCLGG